MSLQQIMNSGAAAAIASKATSAENFKKLEDRIAQYVAKVPDLIALMLYRQLNRALGLQMSGIDGRISNLSRKSEIAPTCACMGRHKADTAFTHWIAGDE